MTTAKDSVEPKTREPIVRRMAVWTLYGLGLAAILLVSGLVWLVLRDRAANTQLQERIAELEEVGLPYDSSSLAQYYERLLDERGADQGGSQRWIELLTVQLPKLSAADEAERWNVADESIPLGSQPWPDEARTLEFLQRWADVRNEARQLALQDRVVRLPIDFDSRPPEFTLIQEWRQLGRLFAVEARVAIRNRDSAATRDAILAIFGCARAVEAQPLLVSQLMSTALESRAYEQLRHALQADVLSTADLKLVQARVARRPALGTVWKVSLNGERGAMLPAFNSSQGERQARGAPPGFTFSLRSRDALTFVQYIDQAVEVPADDLTAFYTGMRQLDESIAAKVRSKNWLTRWDSTLTFLAVPMISAARDAFIRREMLARLSTLAIGLRLYEDEHGVLPESLSQLSELGLDISQLAPLGDQPFGYRRHEDRALLWGFSLQQHQSTPDQPPPLEAAETDMLASMRAEENRSWVWEFPKGEPSRQGKQ